MHLIVCGANCNRHQPYSESKTIYDLSIHDESYLVIHIPTTICFLVIVGIVLNESCLVRSRTKDEIFPLSLQVGKRI